MCCSTLSACCCCSCSLLSLQCVCFFNFLLLFSLCLTCTRRFCCLHKLFSLFDIVRKGSSRLPCSFLPLRATNRNCCASAVTPTYAGGRRRDEGHRREACRTLAAAPLGFRQEGPRNDAQTASEGKWTTRNVEIGVLCIVIIRTPPKSGCVRKYLQKVQTFPLVDSKEQGSERVY